MPQSWDYKKTWLVEYDRAMKYFKDFICSNHVNIRILNACFAGLCMEIGNYLLFIAKGFIPQYFSQYPICKCFRKVLIFTHHYMHSIFKFGWYLPGFWTPDCLENISIFVGTTDTPFLDFWWRFLDFKTGVASPGLHALSPVCNRFLRSPHPSDFLAASVSADSLYPHASRSGARTHVHCVLLADTSTNWGTGV